MIADTGGDQAKKGGEQKAATSWVEFFGSEPLKHPYMYILFLGQDGRGDYVPCRWGAGWLVSGRLASYVHQKRVHEVLHSAHTCDNAASTM
jgi:hypothetical protein